MKLWQAAVLLIVIVLIVIAGAAYLLLRPSPYAVKDASGRDFVYSIEPRENGTAVFWMHDSELGGYCATDPTIVSMLGELAPQLRNRRIELYFRYQSINNGSGAQQFLGSGCPQEEGGITMYHVIEVSEVTGG